MKGISIEVGGPASAVPNCENASTEAKGPCGGSLSAGDYCHLAEECFVLAAVEKEPDAAVELLKAGDDYLRYAAGLTPTGLLRATYMSNIITGRQLRAARILAGLTQKQLAQAVGVHERAARYWELKNNEAPTSTRSSLEKIEAVLLNHGVIVFGTPTPGARLANSMT
jgi:DNA-binding XRE family transcriptional regulator